MKYSTILKRLWVSVYNPEEPVSDVMQTYFHPSYTQCINGVSMNRREYERHVGEQRKSMSVESIDYQHILEQGSSLFALYYPKGQSCDGQIMHAEVIAYFEFQDQLLKRVQGQVRLLDGDLKYADMGA